MRKKPVSRAPAFGRARLVTRDRKPIPATTSIIVRQPHDKE
ncbi:hypothetical protein AB4874_16025 [Thioclava sp. 15-R06ZXC-3]|uniref:Uncharacterized protein n=1 Tax=Thioclava arctica TaxID=3238301 RepID=A0ABV3TPT6_9RHOB